MHYQNITDDSVKIEELFKKDDWVAKRVKHTMEIKDESEKTKTLVVEFETPRKVLSTNEGMVKVDYVGNNSIPVPFWDKVHSYKDYRKQIFEKIAIPQEKIALLGTGANMDNLSIHYEEFDEYYVVALSTAGALNNAIRLGDEKADYIEKDFETYYIKEDGTIAKKEKVGTVNIIVITNANLTEGAMAKAIITITEAKTNVFLDLGVKSTKHPELQSTGTGTDSVIVVGGNGPKVGYTGGHTKLGEMIAKCVKRSVREAMIIQDELNFEYEE
ncbi:adenosylcobinamide amidohydrolase [Methanococcus voltae]|uniref:Adenosylcobinamide amidohydrolase n=1 Tax=Methanococcus voltae (strain ATCC BAA-1334 / A3) TaxID=456320 RepID=D7DT81_METV3|nr:adenosylcobinamide amidohydrolase [Methanococcus voltae]MCS3901191.1 adenosylcobinamide amidohydrolase [Methanococcus voltae]